MMITNPEKLKNCATYGKIIADYLWKEHMIQHVSKMDDKYYFIKSENLRKAILTAPIFIKIVIKIERGWEGG